MNYIFSIWRTVPARCHQTSGNFYEEFATLSKAITFTDNHTWLVGAGCQLRAKLLPSTRDPGWLTTGEMTFRNTDGLVMIVWAGISPQICWLLLHLVLQNSTAWKVMWLGTQSRHPENSDYFCVFTVYALPGNFLMFMCKLSRKGGCSASK